MLILEAHQFGIMCFGFVRLILYLFNQEYSKAVDFAVASLFLPAVPKTVYNMPQ